MTALVAVPSAPLASETTTGLPALVMAAGESAQLRFLEFFAASIRNAHTRRAYAGAVAEFLAWCEGRRVGSITAIQPLHVAAYIEALTRSRAAPTAKLRLAAVRRLFDWLVIGQIVPTNPAASVRGPAHSVKRGKTPVLAPEEARALLDSIDTTTPIGLRDRALIGLMAFSFARIGAALGMKVEDAYVQQRRLWVRLHEKGGKVHEMPCHYFLEDYLHAYIDGCGLAGDPKGRAVPHDRAGQGRPHHHAASAGERLRHDRPAGRGGRHRDQDRQSHLPGDWDHRLPQERWPARDGRGQGQP